MCRGTDRTCLILEADSLNWRRGPRVLGGWALSGLWFWDWDRIYPVPYYLLEVKEVTPASGPQSPYWSSGFQGCCGLGKGAGSLPLVGEGSAVTGTVESRMKLDPGNTH